MQKKNEKILFYGLLMYAVIIFLKDYYVNRFYLMISGFDHKNSDSFGLILQPAVLVVGALLFAWFIKRKRSKTGEKQEITDILGIGPVGTMNIFKSIGIGTVCFFAFNMLKNAIFVVLAANGKPVSISYIETPIDIGYFLFLLVMLGIWMPIGEELVYRGMLFHIPSKTGNVVLLTLLNLLIFAGAHQSGEQVIQAIVLGLILCLFARKTGSISMGIIIHITFNLIGLVITYYFPLTLLTAFGIREDSTKNAMLLGACEMMFVVIVLLMLLVVLIHGIKIPEKTAAKASKEFRNLKQQLPAISMAAVGVVYSVWKIGRAFQMVW